MARVLWLRQVVVYDLHDADFEELEPAGQRGDRLGYSAHAAKATDPNAAGVGHETHEFQLT